MVLHKSGERNPQSKIARPPRPWGRGGPALTSSVVPVTSYEQAVFYSAGSDKNKYKLKVDKYSPSRYIKYIASNHAIPPMLSRWISRIGYPVRVE